MGMKFAVFYPDGDFKCIVATLEEAKNESLRFVKEDIREIPGNFHNEKDRKNLVNFLNWFKKTDFNVEGHSTNDVVYKYLETN